MANTSASQSMIPSTSTPFPVLTKIKTDAGQYLYPKYKTLTASIPPLEELLSLQTELETIAKDVETRASDLKKNHGYLEDWHREAYPESVVNKLFKKLNPANSIGSSTSTQSTVATSSSKLTVNAETPKHSKRAPLSKGNDLVKRRRIDSMTKDSGASSSTEGGPRKNNISRTKQEQAVEDKLTTVLSKFKEQQNDHKKKEAGSSRCSSILDELEFGEDYSKVKVAANQVPIQTFWNYTEPYFRPLVEEDILWLENKEDDPTSYVVPQLGKHYLEKWAAEDHALIPGFDTPSKIRKEGSDEIFNNIKTSNEFLEEVFGVIVGPCGGLTERLLCALIQEEVVDSSDLFEKEDDDTNSFDITDPKRNAHLANIDYEDLESRLKRELQYIGLIDAKEVNWKETEDDDICSTLRQLQHELRAQVQTNQQRKSILLEVAKDRMGYQQYQEHLEELDRQVEQIYLKRMRATKKKKKSTPNKALSDGALQTLEHRKKWIEHIGVNFPRENYTLPTTSIFQEKKQSSPT